MQPCRLPADHDVADVALSHVRMAFGDREVFRDLSCVFPGGKISVILGGSGSGKSTVLRLIGGLVRAQAGSIRVAGEEITQLSEAGMYTVREKLGMMFQGGALLDSMTVFDNLAFPLREHTRLTEREIAAEVRAPSRSGGTRRRRPSPARTSSPAAWSSARRWRARS